MRRALAVLLAMLLLSSTGCASMLQGSRANLTVSTTVPGATVLLDGLPIAQAPAVIPVDTRQAHNIILRAPGYQDYVVQQTQSVGAGWVILDIIAGCISFFIPVIVDAVSGAWNSLDPMEIQAAMQPAGQPVIGVGTGNTLNVPPGYGPTIVEQR